MEKLLGIVTGPLQHGPGTGAGGVLRLGRLVAQVVIDPLGIGDDNGGVFVDCTVWKIVLDSDLRCRCFGLVREW